jgi:hypothetical protein
VRGTTKKHMPLREKGALAHAGTRLKKDLCTTIIRYAQWRTWLGVAISHGSESDFDRAWRTHVVLNQSSQEITDL